MTIYNKETTETVKLVAKNNGVDFLKDFYEVGVNSDFANYNDEEQRYEMDPEVFTNVIDTFEEMITTDETKANENEELWFADEKYIEK